MTLPSPPPRTHRTAALFCDRCHETEIARSFQVTTRAEASDLLKIAAARDGWLLTPQADICPSCRRDPRPYTPRPVPHPRPQGD